MAYVSKGFGQFQSTLLAAPIGIPAGAAAIDCSNSPCDWWDTTIYPSAACSAWYAQCQPNSAFNLMTTQGAIVGGANVLGATAASAFDAFSESATGLPAWTWMIGLGVLAVFLLPKLVK